SMVSGRSKTGSIPTVSTPTSASLPTASGGYSSNTTESAISTTPSPRSTSNLSSSPPSRIIPDVEGASMSGSTTPPHSFSNASFVPSASRTSSLSQARQNARSTTRNPLPLPSSTTST